MMWDPLRFLESCPSSDGACAVVLTDEDGGKRGGRSPPAWVLGTAVRSEPARSRAATRCARRRGVDCAHDVYAQAGITDPREQIDSAELYVPFSWYEPMWLEGHDIAGPGEGWKMVESGDTALDGSFPVNPSGGVLSSNPIGASGLLRFAEAALQVRGHGRRAPGRRRERSRSARPTAAPRSTSRCGSSARRSDAVEQEEAGVTPRSHGAATRPRAPGARRVPRRGAGVARGERRSGAARDVDDVQATSSRWPTTDPRGRAAHVTERARQWQRKLYDGRLRRASPCPTSTAGGAASGGTSASSARSRREYASTPGVFAVGARHGRADDPRARHRGAEAALRPAAAARRRDLVPALLRARRRLRPRRSHHARRCATATSGSSTARRSGTRARTIADWGILLARTDWDVPKHRGITYFLVDMHDARRRGAPAAPDHRRRALQRDVPHRRAHPGRQRARRGRTAVGASRRRRS